MAMPIHSPKTHERSLEYQYQHLSPLDAFKAKGRYLHHQLGKISPGPVERTTEEDRRESTDATDAFALDQKLRERKSNFLTVCGSHVAPSIHSEVGKLEELRRTPSNSSLDSRSSEISGSRYASTIMRGSALNFAFDVEDSGDVVNDKWRQHDTQKWNVDSDEPLSNIRQNSRGEINTSTDALKKMSISVPPSRGRASQENIIPREQWTHQDGLSSSKFYGGRTKSVAEESMQAQASRPGLQASQSPALQSPMTSPGHGSFSQIRPKAAPARSLSYSVPSRGSPNNISMSRPSPGNRVQSARTTNNENIRARTDGRIASLPDAKLSAAVHIELGIEQHEANELPQSTHHFKVAADMGDPTGCLLYGLSLRHGWGIRQDLQRSLLMLQKAVDSIGMDYDSSRASRLLNAPLTGEVAVAIYELGVSYKNGWGVPVDKKVALKYFDLASSWGDVEAMIIAAECYVQGEGCKKDKVKAARYLRRAEGLGRKEIGNSWIWKSKYDDP